MYPVENGTWQGWYSYEQLKRMAELMPEDGDYQNDSPEAEFITGYNTDSYADESIDIMEGIWEEYKEECEEEERETNWEEYLDRVCDNYNWQLTHTWLRVTNLHNESDEAVDMFGRECASGTMKHRIS